MEFLSRLYSELVELKQARRSAIAVMGLSLFVGFLGASIFFNERMAIKDDRIAALQEAVNSGVAAPPSVTNDVPVPLALKLGVIIGGGLLALLVTFLLWNRGSPVGAQQPTPVRTLERYYLALSSLREHADRLTKLRELGGSPSSVAFVQLGLAVKKIRKELVDMSPHVFTTSEALDFSEIPPEQGLSEERVPNEIEHLRRKVLDHWGKRSEALGITPLKFGETPIVKLRGE